jgi:L-alanine-DL-glutamate epimerase-like enolase superfamily enzyme
VVEFTEIMIHELLLKEPLQLQDGYLDVPTGPGLGLELDESKIEMYRTPAQPLSRRGKEMRYL